MSERSAAGWTPSGARRAAGQTRPTKSRTVTVSASEARRLLDVLQHADKATLRVVTVTGEEVDLDEASVLTVPLASRAASA